MASEPKSQPSATPDRLFARTTGLVFGAAIAIILAGHIVLDRAQAFQNRTSELAMAAARSASPSPSSGLTRTPATTPALRHAG